MAVVGSSPGKGIIPLSKQLQHELEWSHAYTQQNRIISVIGRQVILGFQLEAQCDLNGFVSPGSSMHVLCSYFLVLLIQLSHGLGRAHKLKCL